MTNQLADLVGTRCEIHLNNSTVPKLVGTLEDAGRYFPYRIKFRTDTGAMWTPPVWDIVGIKGV